MKRYRLALALAVLALSLSSTDMRAQGDAAASLVGTWRAKGDNPLTLKINGDGKGSLNDAPFDYAVLEDTIVIKEGEQMSAYTFKLAGDALTLFTEDERGLQFERVRASASSNLRGAMTARNAPEEKTRANPLVGRWISETNVAELREDGTLTLNGETLRYSVEGNVIKLFTDAGQMRLPFRLNGDTLSVSVDGEEMVYRRDGKGGGGGMSGARGAASRGANAAELAGKWCYMSNVSANDGGRMSSRCITLNADGTYEYYAETSSSGSVASSASQEYDAGSWTATATTITSHSSKNGTNTYPLEKRNHPKTGDPMLVIDGDAFVTYHQRQPWP